MKNVFIISLLLIFVLTGCTVAKTEESTSVVNETTQVKQEELVVENITSVEEFGGIITLEIPTECKIDKSAGTSMVFCPTDLNPTPTPEMTISSDGQRVNIKKWEGIDTDFYQNVVSTLKVKTPLNQSISINIQ